MADDEIVTKLKLEGRREMSQGLKDTAKDVDDLGKSVKKTSGTSRMLGALGSKLGGLAKIAAKGGIAAGIAAIGGVMYKGFSRLQNIENAQSKLEGLGHSAKSVKKIMADALASVKGTAFGLDEAATTAAGAVAAGIKPGKELRSVLKTVADAASMGQMSMADMGLIFNQVAASGKAQGDVLNQLSQRGIPIVQMLGKQLHKTSAEIYDMSSKGQINFKMFNDALTKGVGGAALKAGDTTAGAFANMGAAAGRLGATLLGGVFPHIKEGLGKLTGWFDALNTTITPTMDRIGGWLSSKLAPKTDVKLNVTAKQTMANPSMAKPRLGIDVAGARETASMFDKIKSSVNGVIDPIKKLAGAYLPDFISAAKDLWSVLGPVLNVGLKVLGHLLTDVIGPALGAVAGFMAKNKAVVYGLGTTIGTLVVFYNLWRVASLAMMIVSKGLLIATKAQTVAMRMLNIVTKANPIGLLIAVLAGLVIGFIYAYKHSEKFRDIVNGALHKVGAVAKWLWNDAFQPALRFIVNGLAFLIDRFGDLLGALGHVPGFGWAKDAANFMHGAADKARELADNINKIKGKTVDVKVNYLQPNPAPSSIAAPSPSWLTPSKPTHTAPSSKVFARANGGPVKAGQPYVVGERRRPELFVPNTDGYVHPRLGSKIASSQAVADSSARVPEGTLSGGDKKIVVPVYIDRKKIAEAMYDETKDRAARL